MIRAILATMLLIVSAAASAISTDVCYSSLTDACAAPGDLTVPQGDEFAMPGNLVFKSTESRTTTFVILPEGMLWSAATAGGSASAVTITDRLLTVVNNGGRWSLSGLRVTGVVSVGGPISAQVIVNNPNTNQRLIDQEITLAVVGGVWNAIITTLNPQSNTNQATVIRIVNPNNADALLRLSPTDDEGIAGGSVLVGVPANGATQVTSADLESGNPNKPIDGAFGDGHGKWWIRAAADYPLLIQVFVRNPQTDSLAEVGGVIPIN